jgi:hypothetical protein
VIEKELRDRDPDVMKTKEEEDPVAVTNTGTCPETIGVRSIILSSIIIPFSVYVPI